MTSHPLAHLNLNLLLALDALLTEEHVTRAAQQVGVSQAAMSQSLSKLRQMLGDKVLVRGQGGMVATPRARRLAPVLRRALLEVDRALRDESTFDPQRSERTFAIATEDMLEVIVGRALLEAFESTARIDVRFLPFLPARMAEDLECGDVDLVIHGRRITGPGIEEAAVYESRIRCIARRNHPAITDELDVETFAAIPQALVSIPSPGRSPVDVGLEKHGLSRRVALRCDSFLAVLQLVSTGDLIAAVPHELAIAAQEVAPVDVFDAPFPLPVTTIRMFWHRRFEDDPAHAWLRKQVQQAFEPVRAALQP